MLPKSQILGLNTETFHNKRLKDEIREKTSSFKSELN